MTLSLSIAESAIAEAKEIIIAKALPPMSISVVDDDAFLIAFCRMDGAPIEAIDASLRKARTTVHFEAHKVLAGDSFKSSRDATSPENGITGLTKLGGGVALRDSLGKAIGAVGISGGSAEEDELVAQAAAAAISG